jgi:hypothetical protein
LGISGLEPLHGFIKQENKVVPVHFQFARKHGRQPEFIERKLTEIAPRPSPPTPVVRAKQSKTPAAAQVTLPFSDSAADKPKEAFVWDESKGNEQRQAHFPYLFMYPQVAVQRVHWRCRNFALSVRLFS